MIRTCLFILAVILLLFANYLVLKPYSTNVIQIAQMSVLYVQRGGNSGSAFAIDDHTVITNDHVIGTTGEIEVFLPNGTMLPGTLIGTSMLYDIAVIEVPRTQMLVPVKLGDSAQLKVGETVTVVGQPQGYLNTVTQGIISKVDANSTYDVGPKIQTITPINPGNSGGPMLASNGDLVGVVNTFMPGASNMGYAIPVNFAKRIWERIIANGSAGQPDWGLFDLEMMYKVHQQGISIPFGIRLANARGTFKDWGLTDQDTITSIDGTPIRTLNDFDIAVESKLLGDSISITVLRGNTMRVIQETVR